MKRSYDKIVQNPKWVGLTDAWSETQNKSDVSVSPTLGMFVPNFGRVWCINKMCGYLAFIFGTYIPQVNSRPTKRKCSQKCLQNESVHITKTFTVRKRSQCENVRKTKVFTR